MNYALIIDENIPHSKQVAQALRRQGYKAIAVGEKPAPRRGSKDTVIVDFAKRNKALIISNDRGYDLEPTTKSDRLLVSNQIAHTAQFGKGNRKQRRIQGVAHAIQQRVEGINNITKRMKR